MADLVQNDKSVAPLQNVLALVNLVEAIRGRDPGMPGIGVFHGYSGYGKTTSASYCVLRFEAVHVEVGESWSRKDFCAAILEELSIKPERTVSTMIKQITEELQVSRRILMVDDAQFLIDIPKGLGVLRDIYEKSQETMILIGEERLPQALQRREDISGRIADWVAAEPATLNDVLHLAKIYCAGVEVLPDLQTKLLTASLHSLRRVSVNLCRIREFARAKGLEKIGVSDWGNRAFQMTSAPKPRKSLGGGASLS